MTRITQEHPADATAGSHLQNTKELCGYKLAALDGDIGHVRDFYFDDNIWVIRYVIADTGSWLAGRQVLISPYAFGKLDQHEKTLHINLRKVKIQDSPQIESHKPVSRLDEVEYYRHYGWPAYWEGDAMWGMSGYPGLAPLAKDEIEAQRIYYHRDDKHLQRTAEVTGYPIQAVDGLIGHVSSFLVDDRSWAIRQMVVEAGHWYSGKEIRIPISQIARISFRDAKVILMLTKAEIEETADREIAKASTG